MQSPDREDQAPGYCIQYDGLPASRGSRGGAVASAESVQQAAGLLGEIRGRPEVEKNFLAWAQGYVGGLLIRAPRKKGLDLTAAQFRLLT
jgi:hypothetical protein